MGPKKSKKGKKEDAGAEEETTFKPKLLPSEHDSFVFLDFKLLNWKYMNFTQKVRDSTHIFTIKKMLRERHGRVDDLKLCLNSFTESNEITNDMLTLKQCGCIGVIPEVILSPEGEPMFDESKIPTIEVFYDFKPTDFSDPVLLYFK